MQPNDQDLQNINLNLSRKSEMSVDGKSSKKKRKTSHKKTQKGKIPKEKWSTKKKVIVWTIVVLLLIGAGVGGFFLYKYLTSNQKNNSPAAAPAAEKPAKVYSVLSGEEITDASLNSSPTYCVQIPNGLDGARPQVGLSSAPVVFEAIAEAGITRFAAIYQNPTDSAIGPIRSLRQYYLDWDTPFDCTVVHAGGSDEALDALKNGDFRDLTEDYTYMWRDNTAYVAPNNLFTSSTLLKKFNTDHDYTTSKVKSFPRLTPEVAAEAREQAIKAAEPQPANADSADETEDSAASTAQGKSSAKTAAPVPLVTDIAVNFGYTAAFNTNYTYDKKTGTYLRAYADGVPHETFTCPEGLDAPAPQQDCGKATQVAPKAIAVMEVNQSLESDGYHLAIRTTGSGKAYVFQNGTATEGTWSRSAVADVIKFTDAAGNDISFVPGQLWIAAIPSSTGSVQY